MYTSLDFGSYLDVGEEKVSNFICTGKKQKVTG